MRTRDILCLITGAILLAMSNAQACGPFAEYDYFVHGGKSPLAMPEVSFYHELVRVLAIPDPVSETEDYSPKPKIETPSWASTLSTDVGELEQALGASHKDAATLVGKYRSMREAMRAQAEENWQKKVRDARQWNYDREARLQCVTGNDYGPLGKFLPDDARKNETRTEPITPFDLEPYEGLLATLPGEFAQYTRGACAFYNEDFDKAIEAFDAVLALSPAQRKHRSTWAAFMLGKSWLHKDPAQALPFFERARQLAGDGYGDSLGLADASRGWEARTNAVCKQLVPAIQGYAAMAAGSRESDRAIGFVSLKWLCQACFGRKAVERVQADGAVLANDAVCRRVVTAWFVANGRRYRWDVPKGSPAAGQVWLEAVEAVMPKDGIFPDADRLAWIAYDHGDMSTAARWLKMADPNAPYAQWIQSKLLMRDGKLAEAEALLQGLQTSVGKEESWGIYDDESGIREPFDVHTTIEVELGLFKLSQGDYRGALDAFLRGGGDEWEDAAYIAKLVMTLDELGDYVSTAAPVDQPGYHEPFGGMRLVYARRLAREGLWEKAAPFFDRMNQTDVVARQIAAYLRDGRDPQKPARQRAEALFKAAECIWGSYGQLIAPELEPNWGFENRGYTSKIDRLKGHDTTFPPTSDELARVARNTAPPYDRFSYRYTAANLMWECAQLLPNNDVLTAHALYLGGRYIRTRDPQRADVFYKTLIRRNPNLAIAEEAKKLKWFPPKFTDTVLYEARPPHISKRKVAGIVVTCGACLLTATVLLIQWKRRAKRSHLP